MKIAHSELFKSVRIAEMVRQEIETDEIIETTWINEQLEVLGVKLA